MNSHYDLINDSQMTANWIEETFLAMPSKIAGN